MNNTLNTNISNIDELYFDYDKLKLETNEVRSYDVIDLRADATGGYARVSTDSKESDWVVPSGWELIDFETQILSQAGDRDHTITRTTNGIYAKVWAKGHPRGAANNRSYIHIKVTVKIKQI